MIPLLHIALCGGAAGLAWGQNARGLAVALGCVLGASVGALTMPHILWHLMAPMACLAGVLWTCRRIPPTAVIHGALLLGISVLVLREGTGVILALCHALAFGGGFYAYRTRTARTPNLHAQLAGIMAASCAAGFVGSVLWTVGYTTMPAQITDLILLGAFVYVARV